MLPQLKEIYPVSEAVQLVEVLKVAFTLSPVWNILNRVVSFVFMPVPQTVRLSTLNTKLSLFTGGLVTLLFTISSLPQATSIITSANILKCINTFLIVFNVCLSLAVTNLTFFLTVLTEVSLSRLFKYHFNIWFLSFRSSSSFFNFFTGKFNHLQGIFQDTNLNTLKTNVSYI